MRISNKIFAIVVPTMTLMMMAMGAVNYKLVRDEQRESSEQFQNELGVKSSREITKSLASVRDQLTWLAQQPVVRRMEWDSMSVYMHEWAVKGRDKFSKLMLIEPDGQYYVAGKGLIADKSLRDREYFAAVMYGEDFAMTSPDFSKSTGEKKYTLAVPVIGENGLAVGCLAANVSLSTLSNMVTADDSVALHLGGEEGDRFMWAVDENGTIIGCADQSKLMEWNMADHTEELEGMDVLLSAVKGNTTGSSYIKMDGRNYYVMCNPIEGTPGWSLISGVSDRAQKATLHKMLWKSGEALVIMIVIIVLLVRFSLHRSLTVPIRQLNDVVERVANGDLSARSTYTSDNEIGHMSQSIDKMCERLKEIVKEIKRGSEILAQSSDQVSALSQNLAAGNNQQASSIEELSATMEQMACNIQQNSENASETNKVSGEAYSRFENVVKSLDTLFNKNRDIAERIAIISDIAAQTNILALNASVEAARAGSSGRGFAVVAKEVQKLAEVSRHAAEEMKNLTSEGAKLTENASQAIDVAMPNIQTTNKLMQEIVTSSMEQSAGAEQINKAITELGTVVRSNADHSEQLAMGAVSLDEQAHKLQDAIQFFHTDDQAA
ncbi:MAG: methyl-accepting chemotaxis protein [Bacteroidales bacterium]|nr:methyl-accepting chemotaxis protein [Bacteroidales bacterium]MDY4521331.1 methyl-accepting chemotaxis protein [Bacteroidales bacterium]